MLVAAAAPLLLTGCLWGPGKFASDLTLKRDGSFALNYRGQIVLQIPEDESTQPWTNAKAKCDEDGKPRACKPAEIADQKAAYEKKREDSLQAAKAFGVESDAGKQLERAAAAYGNEGEDNGVNVGFGSANEIPKNRFMPVFFGDGCFCNGTGRPSAECHLERFSRVFYPAIKGWSTYRAPAFQE